MAIGKNVAIGGIGAAAGGIVGWLARGAVGVSVPSDIKELADRYSVTSATEAYEKIPIYSYTDVHFDTPAIVYLFIDAGKSPEMVMTITRRPGGEYKNFAIEFSRMGWAQMFIYRDAYLICTFDEIIAEGIQTGYYSETL